jgi:hypothetical protein
MSIASLAVYTVVPQWWINMWSETQVWNYFEVLCYLGELRLPTQRESGYALWERGSTGAPPRWTLYKRGVPLSLRFQMPASNIFYLWHVVRPLLQKMLAQTKEAMDSSYSGKSPACTQSKSRSLALHMLHDEFYELLTSPEYVDESIPDGPLQKKDTQPLSIEENLPVR